MECGIYICYHARRCSVETAVTLKPVCCCLLKSLAGSRQFSGNQSVRNVNETNFGFFTRSYALRHKLYVFEYNDRCGCGHNNEDAGGLQTNKPIVTIDTFEQYDLFSYSRIDSISHNFFFREFTWRHSFYDKGFFILFYTCLTWHCYSFETIPILF